MSVRVAMLPRSCCCLPFTRVCLNIVDVLSLLNKCPASSFWLDGSAGILIVSIPYNGLYWKNNIQTICCDS